MDQKDNQQKQHHGHGNGFVLGVIVGVILALLFTTKRGREILKDVTEKGLEKLTDLEKLMKEVEEREFTDEDDGTIDGNDYIAPPAPPPVPTTSVVAEKKEEVPVKEVSPAAAAHAVKVDKSTESKKVKVVEKKVISVVKSPEPTDVPEAPKAARGRRWFRGLKRKG